jgi:hypothetical protein
VVWVGSILIIWNFKEEGVQEVLEHHQIIVSWLASNRLKDAAMVAKSVVISSDIITVDGLVDLCLVDWNVIELTLVDS